MSEKTIVGKIHPDVLRFTAGEDTALDLRLVEWDCVGTLAHVKMLAAMDRSPPVMDAAGVEAVRKALLGVIAEGRAGTFTITEADQDVHLAVERRLTESLGELGRRVHTGRSRNDQVAVDLRLHARGELLGLSLDLCACARDLLAFARQHQNVPMVGRTHLQPAMPSTVGLWASAHAEGLLDDLFGVEAAWRHNDRCPLGSAAGYGVPLPIDRQMTSDLLGFSAPHHNVLHASMARGKNEAVILAACGQVMLTLSRLAEDLILFSMPEFGYFALPPELCTGSSIMPQKYNPDALELIRAKAGRVLGLASGVNTMLKAMPGGYNRDLQETKGPYFEGMDVTRAGLRIMRLMAQRLDINAERLRAGFAPGVFATDAALEKVAAGMAFRDAYQHVRGHLDELKDEDPGAAVAKKTHLGGTAGLDLAALE
ncbi:MAG: argininosuccinate lyase, partial [Kiritimatiellaeota bacterium]|nr:argininosuccinate lyase [Kiritimatiellota bacterium]